MALTDNLASVWHLNNDGLDAYGSNDLTISGGAFYDGTTKKLGSHSGYTDGIDDWFYKDSGVTGIGGSDQMTIATWTRRERTGVQERWLNYGDSSGYKFVLIQIASSNQIQAIFGNDANNAYAGITTTNTLTDTASFHSVVATYNAGTVKVYVDEVDWTGSSFGTWTGDVCQPGNYLRLSNGWNGANVVPFKGWQDEVVLWNREITSDERSTLYNSGAGLEYPWVTARMSNLMMMGVG